MAYSMIPTQQQNGPSMADSTMPNQQQNKLSMATPGIGSKPLVLLQIYARFDSIDGKNVSLGIEI